MDLIAVYLHNIMFLHIFIAFADDAMVVAKADQRQTVHPV